VAQTATARHPGQEARGAQGEIPQGKACQRL